MNMHNSNDPVLTVHEASAFLKLQPDTITALARKGAIKASFISSRWRFLRSDLETFLASGRN